MTAILHQRIQYPAGHGFFHSASISYQNRDSFFDYIYDCGGRNKKVIQREVSKFETYYNNSKEIGMLVISHFHRDHTNGIDFLLRERGCDKLIIPYLKPLDRFYYTALGSSLLRKPPEKILDPISFYIGKCNKLIMIKRGSSNVKRDGKERETVKSSDKSFEIKNINSKGKIQVKKKNVHWIEDSDPLILNQGNDPIWNFEFYVQDSEIYMSAFKERLQEVFPHELNELNLDESDDYDAITEALKEIVKDPLKRKKLRKCYVDTIGKRNFNITSLCMLSYPAISYYEIFDQFPHDHIWLHRYRFDNRIGWLGLGDTYVKTIEECKKIIDHFQDLDKVVSSVTIPHHGSSDNYSSRFLDIVQPRSSFVTCNIKMKKHPAEDVLRDLKSRRMKLNIVTECEDSFHREDIIIFPR